jgi:hypothetical protein
MKQQEYSDPLRMNSIPTPARCIYVGAQVSPAIRRRQKSKLGNEIHNKDALNGHLGKEVKRVKCGNPGNLAILGQAANDVKSGPARFALGVNQRVASPLGKRVWDIIIFINTASTFYLDMPKTSFNSDALRLTNVNADNDVLPPLVARSRQSAPHTTHLVVRRISVIDSRKELLFDESRRSETEHGVGGTSFIVRSACTTSSEALLTDEGSCGLTV